jgi:hypothetical protein
MEELILKGDPHEVDQQQVRQSLDALLQKDDQQLFPNGKTPGRDPTAEIKGSKVLESIYGRYGISYHKERSGLLIAKHISVRNQPALSEITTLVRRLFSKR